MKKTLTVLSAVLALTAAPLPSQAMPADNDFMGTINGIWRNQSSYSPESELERARREDREAMAAGKTWMPSCGWGTREEHAACVERLNEEYRNQPSAAEVIEERIRTGTVHGPNRRLIVTPPARNIWGWHPSNVNRY